MYASVCAYVLVRVRVSVCIHAHSTHIRRHERIFISILYVDMHILQFYMNMNIKLKDEASAKGGLFAAQRGNLSAVLLLEQAKYASFRSHALVSVSVETPGPVSLAISQRCYRPAHECV